MTATSAALAAAPASAPCTPRAWLATVVGTLATRTRPVASSTRTRSVKVPPTSTPTSLVWSGLMALVVIIGIPRAGIPSVTDHREKETQGHHSGSDQEDDQAQLAVGIAPGLARQPAEDHTHAEESGVPHGAASRLGFAKDIPEPDRRGHSHVPSLCSR